MIFDQAQAISAEMAKRKFPITFAYGPQRQPHALGSYVIVIERDRDTPDTLKPVTGAHKNPPHVANRELAVKAVCYVRSPLPGATIAEHEIDCEQIVDGLLVSVMRTGRIASNAASIEIGESRYLKPGEVDYPDGVETWPGVAYLLRWRVARAVQVLDFKAAPLPTGAAAATSNVIRVARNASQDPPEEIPIG